MVHVDNKTDGDAKVPVVVFSSEGWDGLPLDDKGVGCDMLVRDARCEGEGGTLVWSEGETKGVSCG